MINEVLEVQSYLNAKAVGKRQQYRACYMLARWCMENGKDKYDTRMAIFTWANERGIHISYNLNDIINKAFNNKNKLRGETNVLISDEDVEEIKKRFDARGDRLVALAVLCYAKACGSTDGVIRIAASNLESVTSMASTHISGRFIPNLIDFRYLERIASNKRGYTWDGSSRYQATQYKLLVPVKNDGRYKLTGNNVIALYQEIFEGNGAA